MTSSCARFVAILRVLAGCALVFGAAPASAQLRIVTYNTAGAPRPGMDFVLRAIGQESSGASVRQPIDILLLQEQSRAAGLPHAQAFVNLLNSIYAGEGITYARGNVIGDGDMTQSIVYKTNSVELLQEIALGTASSSSQARQAIRHKLKPVGYDDSAAFYIYNSHYKASPGSEEESRRLSEAIAIRNNSNALGAGAHAIYAGDHNFYDASEPAWAALTGPGNGQAFDPVNRVGDWHNNFNFREVHTQSPTTSQRYGGQVTGGLDDRFDFQLATGEMLDNEGLSYIADSYHTFGNNGTTFNTDVDFGTNTYAFNLVEFDPQNTRTELLTALASVSDHLPVIADYQLPAKMSVQVAEIPTAVTLGATIPIEVSIENVAPVANVGFADELDYTLSVSGDLFGGAVDVEPAAGGGHAHDIFLNTATPGAKSGVITVMSTSQQTANALFTMPVSFTVLGPEFLAADFDQDGSVDGDDLAAWSVNFGIPAGAHKSQGDANSDGNVDGADFLAWQRQLGAVPSSIAALSTPEPAGASLAAFCGIALSSGIRRRTA
ncbi:MAG TPA: hypothetical protein VF175_01565 [Lacipirellula sp.]